MLEKVFNLFNSLDIKIKKIMKCGFIFSLCFCLIATLILLTYESIYASPDLYYIGLQMIKTGFTFVIEFIICGIAFDKIKQQLI